MFITPYETKALKNFSMGDIDAKLKMAQAKGDLRKGLLGSAEEFYIVAGKSTTTETIKPFPLPFRTTDAVGEMFTSIDLREFNSQVVRNGNLIDPDGGTADLIIRAAILQTIWADKGIAPFMKYGSLPMKVFSTWIGSAVSRVFALDLRQRNLAIAITAWYWICLHYNASEMKLGSSDIRAHATKLASSGICTPTEAQGIIEQLGHIANIDALVEAYKTTIGVKVTTMQPVTLYATLGNSWYGGQARIYVGVAMEFPPMFVAILYSAIDEQSHYRKSPIVETAKVFSQRRDEGKAFISNVKASIRYRGD